MRAVVLEPESGRSWIWLAVATLASGGLHVALALSVAQIHPTAPKKPVWVEMTMQVHEAPPPPPPPEPEPEPEPEKPKPPPKPEIEKVKPPDPLPSQPPPEAQPERVVRRITQGLNANSFSTGSGTGLTVRAGTTTATRAGKDVASLDDANEFATVPYTAASTPPKLKGNPALVVPQEVIDQRIEGRVDVELTIGPDGTVLDVVVVSSLQAAADAACVAHAKHTRWTPNLQDGQPTAVKGVPFSCRFERQ